MNQIDDSAKVNSHKLLLSDLRHVLGLPALESSEMQPVNLKSDEVLFYQGDPGDSLYVLTAGVLGVRRRHEDGREAVIDKLAPGAIVGEMALLSGQARTATVYAVNDCRLLRLSKSDFDQLSAADQRSLAEQGETVVNRWRRLQLSRVLGRLFGNLEANTLHMLEDQLTWHHLSNGDILFDQGEPSDGMYIVLNGRLHYAAVNSKGQTVATGEIGPGETVGEFALITDELRSATVFAVRESNLVKITPERFNRLTQEYPHMMGRLTRIIVERRQRTLQQIKPAAPEQITLAIVPTTPNIDATRFAQELAAAMSPFGATLALDAASFSVRAGQGDAAQTALDSPHNLPIINLLDELEASQKYLLYVADAHPSNWTSRCLGQADRVLLLADPAQNSAVGAVETHLAQFDVPLRTELVLWHPPETQRPQGTAVWFNNRTLHTHHHVRQGDEQHMARLARRITGHAVALVLSGGAARGFAHMGVHRALEELNIPIDYIGSTSMGAVIGGSMIIYETNERLVAQAANFADPKQLFDRTLPLTALTSSRKVTRFTKQHFGDHNIEDQWIPFFCVASNLTTAEPVIYQRGPIWRAVRASLAIPGVFTPVMEDGDVIVDGGVMNNFPAVTMAHLCESVRIIGVNVSPHHEKKRNYDFETDISGWRVFFSRLNPFAKSLRAPSLVGTILRTFEINSISRAKDEEVMVDLMIYPDVRQFKTTAYDQYEAIAQVGYDAALAPLTAWKAQRLSTQSTV